MNKLFPLIALCLSISYAISQQHQYDLVLGGGTGYSISNSTTKAGVNIGLEKAGLSSRVHKTWLVNGMADFAIIENVSIGVAYSHVQFHWNDRFSDTIQGQPIMVNGKVDIQKRNYAIRGLYHFGKWENFEIYTGLRLGITHWKIDFNLDAQVSTENPASDFKFPATYPSVQGLIGFRHNFLPFLGWFGELGVGTSPYFCSIGLHIKTNMQGN